MRTPTTTGMALASALTILLSSGCDEGGNGIDNTLTPAGDTPKAETRSASIRFDGRVGDDAFVCGTTYEGVGTGIANAFRANDFRIYISEPALVSGTGEEVPVSLEQDGKWQYRNVALLDFENGCDTGTAEMRRLVTGTIPNDEDVVFTGICFTLGIPFEDNHLDNTLQPSPLNVSGMFWNWQGGHKFVRIDGVGDPDGAAVGYNVHLGSTGCKADGATSTPIAECKFQNRPRVCLTGFDADVDTVGAYLDRILEDSDIATNVAGSAPGCMSGNSDPECIEILPKFGLDFVFDDGQNAPQNYPGEDPQRFFGILPR